MVEMRWANGVVCPRCNAADPMFLKTRRIWKCSACRRQFSAKVGTIFEDSALGFDKWLPALWMLANAKNGISSYEVHRALHVHSEDRVVHAVAYPSRDVDGTFKKTTGPVEIDECFVGGRRRTCTKRSVNE